MSDEEIQADTETDNISERTVGMAGHLTQTKRGIWGRDCWWNGKK